MLSLTQSQRRTWASSPLLLLLASWAERHWFGTVFEATVVTYLFSTIDFWEQPIWPSNPPLPLRVSSGDNHQLLGHAESSLPELLYHPCFEETVFWVFKPPRRHFAQNWPFLQFFSRNFGSVPILLHLSSCKQGRLLLLLCLFSYLI